MHEVDLNIFKDEISKVSDVLLNCNTLENSVNEYNSSLQSLLDKHAPTIQKSVIVRPNTKWYTSNLRSAKVVRRRLERKWKKSGLENDWIRYRNQCKFVSFLLKEAKTKFYSTKVSDAECDKKALFSVAKEILNWKPEIKLPSDDKGNLPNNFSEFFMDKIIKIRSNISSQNVHDVENSIKEELFSWSRE